MPKENEEKNVRQEPAPKSEQPVSGKRKAKEGEAPKKVFSELVIREIMIQLGMEREEAIAHLEEFHT